MIDYLTRLLKDHDHILPVKIRLVGAMTTMEGTLAAADEHGIIFVGKNNKDDVSAFPWTSLVAVHPKS